MKDIVMALFGTYEPIMTQVAIDDGTSVQMYDAVASGVSGLDWPWIAGVFLFVVVLWSFFRLVGILLNK